MTEGNVSDRGRELEPTAEYAAERIYSSCLWQSLFYSLLATNETIPKSGCTKKT